MVRERVSVWVGQEDHRIGSWPVPVHCIHLTIPIGICSTTAAQVDFYDLIGWLLIKSMTGNQHNHIICGDLLVVQAIDQGNIFLSLDRGSQDIILKTQVVTRGWVILPA